MERDWKIVRDRVMALVANRVTMSTPTPMEIDRVKEKEEWGGAGDYEGDEGEDNQDYVEVDAVGRKGDGRCRRCGGKGHFARECPTPAGKGIEKGGYGKSDGKNGGGKGGKHGKDSGKGNDGGPKGAKGSGMSYGYQAVYQGGYQGSCFKCGKVGHQSR